MKPNEHNLREELKTWCASFPAQLRFELDWDDGQTEQQAWWLLYRFLNEIEDKHGNKDFCWVAYPENVSDTGSPFQVYVGGLKRFGRQAQRKWVDRWDTQAGCAEIWDFNPHDIAYYAHNPAETIAYSFRLRTPIRAVSDVMGAAEEFQHS